MASSSSQTTILLFILIAFSSFKSSKSCGIAVYWGQNGNEGTLFEACNTGLYKYINLAFLINFGSGHEPVLNLDGHCNPHSGTCRGFSEEIHFCQSLGIEVLLSVGGSLSSPQEAKEFADYLWKKFLAPHSDGPLGKASLDGINFEVGGGSTRYWDVVAYELANYRQQTNISLAAAAYCLYPDYQLNAAIRTGILNYAWVQFYNNPRCDYRSGVDGIIRSWNAWSSALSVVSEGTQLFMGLPASPEAASGGYIPPDVLSNDILPVIRDSENYGGVMLWSRYYDLLSGYGSQISSAVCVANLKLPSDGLYSNE